MSPGNEKKALQVVIAIASLVPLSMGLMSVVEGPAVLKGIEPPVPVDLDSHFRYLSGLLLGLGLAFLACIPAIERKTTLFRTLTLVVFVGGVSRLASLIETGTPSGGHQFGLVMELVVVPLIMLWQTRVAGRFRS